mmetsp:Transcript_31517/g.89465  ORF Transcript_31517/g.89465 Transcript_31517/m.89465 type:complete len:294 (+) Transcript_31517:3572-4453(+)
MLCCPWLRGHRVATHSDGESTIRHFWLCSAEFHSRLSCYMFTHQMVLFQLAAPAGVKRALFGREGKTDLRTECHHSFDFDFFFFFFLGASSASVSSAAAFFFFFFFSLFSALASLSFFFFFFSDFASSSPSLSFFFFFFSVFGVASTPSGVVSLFFFFFFSSPPGVSAAGSSTIAGVVAAAAGPEGADRERRYSLGVWSLGLPCLSSLPSEMSFFFCVATGPSPQRRGYVSRSITTRLIFATQPWSQVAITAVVIWAMPTAIASPLVVIRTTSSLHSTPDSKRSRPGIMSLAP